MISGTATGYSSAKPLDYKALLAASEKALLECGKSIMSDFGAATATWFDKPQFQIEGPYLKQESGGPTLWIQVTPRTNVDIFKWVDRGTEPHMIFPRRAKFLSYQRDFTPKTQVYSMYSRPGGKSGPYIRRTAVTHPGIEPRLFTALTAANHQPWWNGRVAQLVLDFCVRASGKVQAL